MNNNKGKKIFFILYVILACADFLYSIINQIRHLFYTEFSFSILFSSLGKKILYLLPLITFIILSKRVSEIEDSQKIMKIKKYVIIYLFACLIFGAVNYLLKVPFFISCLFYTNSWLFYLIYIIAYNQLHLIYSLVLDICFFVISILFIKSLGKRKNSDADFMEGMGKTSTGFKLGIANIIILSIQTVLNIVIAIDMHDNMSGVSGEQAMGAAFVALILIVFKVFLDLILLPAIPLSIAGIIKCNSKKEIEQDRKNRLLGKKINIVCLVIAVAELLLIW
ncbi:MAG: hypothetical protein SPH83_00530 [Treponema sp.]|nr:hypothetical protein [Spirochaetales bacterium]MDY5918053.1 hypothetical protein [Treponema sp.]MDY6188960.1 hypothetical protein [Treponema sp.]